MGARGFYAVRAWGLERIFSSDRSEYWEKRMGHGFRVQFSFGVFGLPCRLP